MHLNVYVKLQDALEFLTSRHLRLGKQIGLFLRITNETRTLLSVDLSVINVFVSHFFNIQN